MTGVLELKRKQTVPAELSTDLRALADRCDRGEISAAIVAYIQADDAIQYLWPSNPWDSMALATLLQSRAVERQRS